MSNSKIQFAEDSSRRINNYMIKGFLGGCLERFGSENFRARGGEKFQI
jgi:hypothetical protein